MLYFLEFDAFFYFPLPRNVITVLVNYFAMKKWMCLFCDLIDTIIS